MWKCTECHKEFARNNQSHKCEVVALDALFINRSPEMRSLYDHFLKKISGIGNFKVTTSKKAITLYAPSGFAFMGIEVKKKFLDTWFALNRKVEDFPVNRVVQVTKTRFGHFVRLYEKGDADQVLKALIKESYNFINSKSA